MKKFILCSAVVLSFSAHAGPEEHREAQKCYVLSAIDAKRATENVPTELCIETLNIDTASEKINIDTYFFKLFFANVQLNSLTRKNEETLNFKSSGSFYFMEDEQNGQLEKLTVLVSGKVDNEGVANPADLKIEVKQDRRYSPHSAINSTIYQYQLQ